MRLTINIIRTCHCITIVHPYNFTKLFAVLLLSISAASHSSISNANQLQSNRISLGIGLRKNGIIGCDYERLIFSSIYASSGLGLSIYDGIQFGLGGNYSLRTNRFVRIKAGTRIVYSTGQSGPFGSFDIDGQSVTAYYDAGFKYQGIVGVQLLLIRGLGVEIETGYSGLLTDGNLHLTVNDDGSYSQENQKIKNKFISSYGQFGPIINISAFAEF